MSKYRDNTENDLRNAAWIGDSVLSLYLRQLLLLNQIEPPAVRVELFKYFSSNQFLNIFGRPTAMEAEIGQIYESAGLAAAFDFLETKYLPTIRKQLSNRLFANQKVKLEFEVGRKLSGPRLLASVP